MNFINKPRNKFELTSAGADLVQEEGSIGQDEVMKWGDEVPLSEEMLRLQTDEEFLSHMVVLLVEEKVRRGLVLTERDMEMYRERQQFLGEEG